ncbi:hypothetical protein B9Z65_3407 [Elsinoe australis]|uniref:LysM domain-containing protein n=1 Tax=Elsinoe australis TaxID=40998 RepID=A0A2P7ZYE7_9PEZI|nr:hypothetical protein B9Z65_3407 [Elsinoe australis]
MACRKDKSTGEFCDPKVLAWSQNSSAAASQQCSDCWLGVLALQLSNPLGYDEGLAEKHASLTSSCKSPDYTYASPTAFALNATATTQPPPVTVTPAPECTGTYIVKEGDTCSSVAKSLKVSTYDLVYHNNIDLYCQSFGNMVGKALCIPPTCTTYTWNATDTCQNAIKNYQGVTLPQFLAWNPMFSALCRYSAKFAGYEVCMSPPGGVMSHDNDDSTGGAPTAPSVAAPVPTNARDGSNRRCGKWATIIAGDTCALLSLANGISLSDFRFLNPTIDANCTNLLLDLAYCVKQVGDIMTYPSYSAAATLPITITRPTFATVTATPTATANPGYTEPLETLPKASGTLQDCEIYRDFDSKNDHNSCEDISYLYTVSLEDLVRWNPSLPSDRDSCKLSAGFSYCVERGTGLSPIGAQLNCITQNITRYGKVEAGTVADCSCWTIVRGSSSMSYTCKDLTSDFQLALSDLLAWNTWLGTSCETGLYADMQANDSRAVCVRASGGTTTAAPGPSTSLPGAPSTAPPETSPTTPPPGPSQPDTVAGCQKYHLISEGQGCQTMTDLYGVPFSQLLQWNPSIGSNCENLWLGYAYCVQAPATSTGGGSPTPTAVTPPAPTQSGVSSKCNKYYKVVEGDSCPSIQAQFGVTLTQLYEWNPSIGADCSNMWLNYAVCVGIAP